ncbi:heptaprenyl diphosphate synthase [Streptomyces sp. TLI_053]|uniref:polyprenyl synthetase family protein n=1 Tax=Streptomyces sp. TLI_053 TaxID=1855352 RepID=UPI00087A7D3F|nr:polyprenyl synthetase family protein [Streptomyces sp. TLI_053]SDT83376.1 heptaprenyl diphosphate synthase [Streptomyces sp. TLI_053]
MIVDAEAAPGMGTGTLQQVWQDLLAEDLVRYRQVLEEVLRPQAEYLTPTEYALHRRGKKLRPMLLLLAARMVHGTGRLPDKVVNGAVSLEMLHVATLIHDDVVDDSSLRRGLPSVNAARGTHTAVLIGDLQFVQAIRGFVDGIDAQRDIDLVRTVLDTAFRVCCGELDELRTDPAWDTEALLAHYWRTVERKTAVLFGLACEAGVTLADGRTRDARRAGFYGRRLGRAFQVMDDILDLTHDQHTTGKPPCTDLARGRWSLPLIHAAHELGPAHPATRILRGEAHDDAQLRAAACAVRATGACATAYAQARNQALDALTHLQPFPPGVYRDALAEIAWDVVDRPPQPPYQRPATDRTPA